MELLKILEYIYIYIYIFICICKFSLFRNLKTCITNSMPYGIWRLNTAFTRSLQQSLLWSTQFLVLAPISLRSIVRLSSHLHLSLPKGLYRLHSVSLLIFLQFKKKSAGFYRSFYGYFIIIVLHNFPWNDQCTILL